MSCAYCRKRVWFWQSSVDDIAGVEHRRCWRDRWRNVMEGGYFGRLSVALQSEALLIMPEEYVEAALREPPKRSLKNPRNGTTQRTRVTEIHYTQGDAMRGRDGETGAAR